MGAKAQQSITLEMLIANIVNGNRTEWSPIRSVGRSEQLNKTHYFRKIFFVTSSLYRSINHTSDYEIGRPRSGSLIC